MSVALQLSEYDKSWQSLKERFPSHTYTIAKLEDVFNFEDTDLLGIAPHLDGGLGDNSISKQKRLEDFLTSLPSAASRADMVGVLFSRLIKALAEERSCDSIIYGDSTTRLAERTLTETAKGRAGALPWLTADGQFPHGVKVVYPMRDLLRKEILAYTAMIDPPLTPLILEARLGKPASVSSKDTTIEELMGQYFASVEENYPSIVANVVRTSSRLAAPPTDRTEGRRCQICRLPLTEGSEGLRWMGEQEGPMNPIPRDKSKDVVLSCYGCARSMLTP
ncbi:MAG: hypothetical protein L6R41_006274 [Letrouitia leprolyta]|nr:MAG: hypothetical protein L6R41_006274 [Letrouitia leprolyta]